MMSTPITLDDLQAAVEQLRPELATLLGTDYPAFVAELDSYLDMRNINLLLYLFGRYPAVDNRLLYFLRLQEAQTIKVERLLSRANITLPSLYKCAHNDRN